MRIPALLLAALTTSAFANTATIVPDADTTLQESAAANNFGGRTTLQAGATSGATTRTRAVVSFNVGAAVPPGATIVAAHIIVNATDEPAIPLTTQAFEFRRVLADWREGTQAAANGGAAATTDATWSHRLFPNTTWASPGGSVGTDAAAVSSATFVIGGAGAYDTGTDSGTTFSSANLVITPRCVITRIVTPPLGTNGSTPPMGTYTFTPVRIVPAP